MTGRDGERGNTFVSVTQFAKENAADFPGETIGGKLFGEIKECADRLKEQSANQASATGDSKLNFVGKDTARENLREDLTDISQIARSMAYEIEGLEEKFRVPVNRADRLLLAAARAFLSDIEAYKAKFIEYGLPEDFTETLQNHIEEFEQATETTAVSRGEQVASTAEIGSVVKKGMVALRRVDPIVRQKYKNDPGKLAAWTTASHVKRAPATKPADSNQTK